MLESKLSLQQSEDQLTVIPTGLGHRGLRAGRIAFRGSRLYLRCS